MNERLLCVTSPASHICPAVGSSSQPVAALASARARHIAQRPAHRKPDASVRAFAAAALLCLTASTLVAHDTWLLPSKFRSGTGTTVKLDLTSGMVFPKLEYAIKPERVERATVDCANGRQPLPKPRTGTQSLRFAARCNAPGVAQIVVELAPKDLELTPDKVTEYLREIGAENTIGREWAALPEPKRWRERYTKHAKTFVRFGSGTASETPSAAGMSLELVPQTDPTRLTTGYTLPILLLDRGKPLANASIGVATPGKSDSFVVTDASGRASVNLDRSGRWLLRFTQIRRSSIEKIDWESDFTTLVIDVLSREK